MQRPLLVCQPKPFVEYYYNTKLNIHVFNLMREKRIDRNTLQISAEHFCSFPKLQKKNLHS